MSLDNKIQKRRVNILDLRDSPWVDGPGRTILDCASSLEGENYHFVIGSFSGGLQKTNEYADEAIKRGLDLIVIKESKAFDKQVIKQILNIIETRDIDIIHTHDFRSDLFGLICAKIKKKPVVSTVHGWICNDMKGKVYRAIDKLLLRYFDQIITVSQKVGELVQNAFIASKKITTINNALHINNYCPNRSEGRLRSELGIGESTFLIANIGRLSPEKGQEEFLQAGKKLLSNHKNIKLVLIGVGPDEVKLKQFVEDNRMSDFVIFLGFRKDMINIYNSVDLIVQTSFTEGMPNIVLEGLLMQVPVIATEVGGTGEIIEQDVTGVLIEPGNISIISEKMREFLINPDKFKKMARQGRDVIAKNFDHKLRVRKLKKVYDGLVPL